jgi:hypothetical protein
MEPENNKDNNVGLSNGKDLPLLEEAHELARIRNWTRPFALYIMFCQAMSVGDKIRAEACMNLSEKEGINSLVDPQCLGDLKRKVISLVRPNRNLLHLNKAEQQQHQHEQLGKILREARSALVL